MRNQAIVTDPLRFELAQHVRRYRKDNDLPTTAIATGVAVGMREIEAGRSLAVALAAAYSRMRAASPISVNAPLIA